MLLCHVLHFGDLTLCINAFCQVHVLACRQTMNMNWGLWYFEPLFPRSKDITLSEANELAVSHIGKRQLVTSENHS